MSSNLKFDFAKLTSARIVLPMGLAGVLLSGVVWLTAMYLQISAMPGRMGNIEKNQMRLAELMYVMCVNQKGDHSERCPKPSDVVQVGVSH